jgi:hypothetical protein
MRVAAMGVARMMLVAMGAYSRPLLAVREAATGARPPLQLVEEDCGRNKIEEVVVVRRAEVGVEVVMEMMRMPEPSRVIAWSSSAIRRVQLRMRQIAVPLLGRAAGQRFHSKYVLACNVLQRVMQKSRPSAHRPHHMRPGKPELEHIRLNDRGTSPCECCAASPAPILLLLCPEFFLYYETQFHYEDPVISQAHTHRTYGSRGLVQVLALVPGFGRGSLTCTSTT